MPLRFTDGLDRPKCSYGDNYFRCEVFLRTKLFIKLLETFLLLQASSQEPVKMKYFIGFLPPKEVTGASFVIGNRRTSGDTESRALGSGLLGPSCCSRCPRVLLHDDVFNVQGGTNYLPI